MEMSGEYRIPAPRSVVWAALNDPEMLRHAVPGCQSLARVGPDAFEAKVVAKVGPVKATFTGRMTMTNVKAPESYTLNGEGKGGAAGFAKGAADVALTEDGGTTVLRYVARGQVGGKLAQLGARLIDTTAKKMADEFFAAFAARLGGTAFVDRLDHTPAGVPQLGDEPSEPVVLDKAEEAAVVAEAGEERLEVAAGRGALGGPVVWGLLVIVVVAAAVLLLSRPL